MPSRPLFLSECSLYQLAIRSRVQYKEILVIYYNVTKVIQSNLSVVSSLGDFTTINDDDVN